MNIKGVIYNKYVSKTKVGQDLCSTTVHVALEYRQRTLVRIG